jgi:hypothetical protein
MRKKSSSRKKWQLICYLLQIFTLPSLHAASDPQAIRCAQDFLNRYSKIKNYDSVLEKKEWDLEGELLHDEKIQLTFEKPKKITLKYLNEGNTGIRNNGMTLRYVSGETVSIQLGETRGLGFLVNGPASLAIGDSLSIFDSRVLENEIFIINRSGFDLLAHTLKAYLPSLNQTETGGLQLTGSPCQLEYFPHLPGEVAISLEPQDSIEQIEEKFGTLGYFIYQRNRDQLDSIRDLYVREKKMTLQIPKSFPRFQITLGKKTQLPEHIVFFLNDKKVGQYHFEYLKVVD